MGSEVTGTRPAAESVSLFGGDIVDASTAVRALSGSSDAQVGDLLGTPPDTTLPATSTKDLFMACWNRFHFLKDLTAETVGHWSPSAANVTPQHVPGMTASFFGSGVVGLYRAMGLHAMGLAEEGDTSVMVPNSFFDELPTETLAWSWAGFTATPYLFEAGLAGAVLASTPPDHQALTDLRLPARRTLALFGAPFVVDRDSGWWSDAELELASDGDRLTGLLLDEWDVPHTDGIFDMRRPGFATLLYTHGCRIHGVLMFSDEHGFIRDELVWLVEVDDGHPDGGLMQPVNGRLSCSALAPLVHNVAAAAAWAKWTPPDPDLVARMPGTHDELDAVRNKGSFRRLARRPGGFGVHVITPLAASRTRGDGDGVGGTVAPHVRRGHWRSVRIATRDADGVIVGDTGGVRGVDWHYEGRWVPPTFVNADRAPDRNVVYRIPPRSQFTGIGSGAATRSRPSPGRTRGLRRHLRRGPLR